VIQAVVFDWGGTLSVFADVEMIDMWRLAARHLAPEHEAEMVERLIAVEARSWEEVRDHQTSTTLSTLLVTASQELGLDVAEAVLEEAATHHLDSWTPHIVHDPDAAPTLAALRDAGYKIGLLSNTHWPRAFHEHFLERDGLDKLIDVRCYTSEMPRTKPHPDAFRTVLDQLEVADPRCVVFVGDRLHDDIWGAQQLGMKAVLRPNTLVPSYDVEPDAVIDRLPELIDIVAEWSSEASS
jgi:putative hydrolase of the HAD superfamily